VAPVDVLLELGGLAASRSPSRLASWPIVTPCDRPPRRLIACRDVRRPSSAPPGGPVDEKAVLDGDQHQYDLLAQSGETLAGRISYAELDPLDISELGREALDPLWLRGGFPESYLAATEAASLRWREDFIRTYLEREIPQLGPRVPAETLRRLWTMLAHNQGQLLNGAAIARGLGVSAPSVATYLDLLVDLLLVRRLAPRVANVGKRQVRSPKIYVRDSGLLHALLGLADKEALLGHPVLGRELGGPRDREPDRPLPGAGRADLLPHLGRRRDRPRPALARRPGVGDRGQAQPLAHADAQHALGDLRPGAAAESHRLPRRGPLQSGGEDRGDRPT
jgi:hypothetical protein